ALNHREKVPVGALCRIRKPVLEVFGRPNAGAVQVRSLFRGPMKTIEASCPAKKRVVELILGPRKRPDQPPTPGPQEAAQAGYDGGGPVPPSRWSHVPNGVLGQQPDPLAGEDARSDGSRVA